MGGLGNRNRSDRGYIGENIKITHGEAPKQSHLKFLAPKGERELREQCCGWLDSVDSSTLYVLNRHSLNREDQEFSPHQRLIVKFATEKIDMLVSGRAGYTVIIRVGEMILIMPSGTFDRKVYLEV